MPRAKKRTLTSNLPPVPITPTMKEELFKLAEASGVSMSEVVRVALSIFLAGNSNLIDIPSTQSISER